MDCSWWLYQCLVLELTDLMSSILPWSPWRISSLSAVLSGYANVCVRKLRVGEFKSFNSFNRHSSVQIYNEKKKTQTEEQVYQSQIFLTFCPIWSPQKEMRNTVHCTISPCKRRKTWWRNLIKFQYPLSHPSFSLSVFQFLPCLGAQVDPPFLWNRQ